MAHIQPDSVAPQPAEDSERAHTVPKSCCGFRALPRRRDQRREGSPGRETHSRSPQSQPAPLRPSMAEFPVTTQEAAQLRIPSVGPIPRGLSPIRTRKGEAHSIPASRHQRNMPFVIDSGCVNSCPQVSNSHIPSHTRPTTIASSPSRIRQPLLAEDLNPHVMEQLPPQRDHGRHTVQQLESPARAPSSRGNLSAAVNAATAPQARSRVLKLRIEVELMLTPKTSFTGTLQRFVQQLAENYNELAHGKFPALERGLHPHNYGGGDSHSWYVTATRSFSRTVTEGPRNLVLVSPKFDLIPGCNWRDDIEAMWTYLERDYNLMHKIGCSTNVDIFLRQNYNTQELKRLAQAILHFEPAFEALIDPFPRDTAWPRKNWLDNDLLAKSNISRTAAIDLFELVDVRSGTESISMLIGSKERAGFCWDFSALTKSRYIRFRKAPAVTTPEDITGWVETATSFLQASFTFDKGSANLQRIPSNIQGLLWFLSRGRAAGIKRPESWARLHDGRNWSCIVSPLPSRLDRSVCPRVREYQLRLIKEDRERLERLAENAASPYC